MQRERIYLFYCFVYIYIYKWSVFDIFIHMQCVHAYIETICMYIYIHKVLPFALYSFKETYRKGKAWRRQPHGSYSFLQGQNVRAIPPWGSFAMWFVLYWSIWLEVSQNTVAVWICFAWFDSRVLGRNLCQTPNLFQAFLCTAWNHAQQQNINLHFATVIS